MKSDPAGIRSRIQQLARDMYDERKAAYEHFPRIVPASPDDFADLDMAFYDSTSTWLFSEGFRLLADLINKDARDRHQDLRSVSRVLVSDDGAIAATVSHLRSAGKMRFTQLDIGRQTTNYRGLDLTSEFADATFLVTNNVRGTTVTIDCPAISTQRLSRHAPLNSLLKLHRASLEQRRQDPAHLPIVPMRTLEEALASERRCHEIRGKHLRRVGYFVDVAREFNSWLKDWTPDMVRMLVAEIAAMQKADGIS